MAGRKGGLGKGLGALLPNAAADAKVKHSAVVQDIDVSEIVPNRAQPRTDFDEEALKELASSVKEVGVLQPILVRKMPNGYELIAGERRLRAARVAGLSKVPAIVRSYTDQEISEIALIENLQREDLSAIEEARAYKSLMDGFSLTQDDVAKKVGRSRPHVANMLRLLKLAPKVQDMLANGTLSMGQARPLAALAQKKLQERAAAYIIEHELSARDAESLVKRLMEDPTVLDKRAEKVEPAKDPDVEAYIREAEGRLHTFFGTKVQIHHGRKKGRIEIEFYSPEDLERIIDDLTKKYEDIVRQKKEALRAFSTKGFTV